MRSTLAYWSYVALYLTLFCIIINLSCVVSLHGKNVKDAKVEEFPFVVSIEMNVKIGSNTTTFCVGTLLSPSSVLTAAHCLVNLEPHQVSVVAGSSDLLQGKRYHVKCWIGYDQWMNTVEDLKLSRNDIAVITLIQPIIGCGASSLVTSARDTLYNTDVRMVGWGFRDNEPGKTLMKVATLKVISNTECEKKIESVYHTAFYIPKDLFCSLADPWILGDCADSGAPILDNLGQLVGIHRGICPETIKNYHYPEEFINQNLINVHLHIYEYIKFIKDVKT